MVFCAGVTLIVPLSATRPMPLSMVTVSALRDCQVSCAVPPAATSTGMADIVTVGCAASVGGLLAEPPAHPAAVMARMEMNAKKNNRGQTLVVFKVGFVPMGEAWNRATSD